jgi:DNA-binding NtrC family response regulator
MIRAGRLLAPRRGRRHSLDVDTQEDSMRLVADRFVVDTDTDNANAGCALDLATGDAVTLTIAPLGGDAEARRWMIECDDAWRVRRGYGAHLVDYGRLGLCTRFEAWAGPMAGAVTSAEADTVPAVGIICRPEDRALAEMCDAANGRRPRAMAIWGPSGSGRDTLAAALARAARINGVVPVDARGVDRFRDLLRNRTLLVIDRSGSAIGVPVWLSALLHTPRPHLCLLVGREEVPGIDGLALGPIPAAALVAATVAPRDRPRVARRVAGAAARAHGWPGRFVRALWPAPAVEPAAQRAVSLSRVAEQPVAYGNGEPTEPAPGRVVDFASGSAAVHQWASPAEVAALRRRLAGAETLLLAGRHAPAVRSLRQVVSALARRDAWTDAIAGTLLLASALLRRGRPRDALRALDGVRDQAERSADRGHLLEIALLSGDAWIDLAGVDEGERVLVGAGIAARACGDDLRAARAAVALSRCLFWRGSYDQAAQTAVSAIVRDDAAAAVRVRRLRCLARARIAQGDGGAAMAALEEARSATEAAGDLSLVADVAWTSAQLRLAAGDRAGVEADVSACLAAARRARHPMRALRARLLHIECERRRGSDRIRVGLAELHRLVQASPPIVRARHELLRALCEVPGPQTATRQAARTGLKALELFGGAVPRRVSSAGADPFVEDIVGILQVCQHADDEAAVLAEVCARVRGQLHAAAAAFACRADRRFELIAADGPRMDTDIAARACDAGATIAPHRVRERLEGAAPVQYGGRVIGALMARWTLGNSYDVSRAPAVLSMAAAAAAPILAAVQARRSRPLSPSAPELIGATAVMADLRSAVERAAPAPFAVLIEGESGSGKELVARAIHRGSPRRDRPFCTLNCAALPDDLVEAELFGHARGSFTGAVADRPGVFEEAHSGTLFLDEVGELSARAQAKLLRVIQEGELRRIGENVPRRVDVRIVCATNRQLRQEAEEGRFRRDLWYRLDVIRIVVPPLRARRDDVPVLVDHYWEDATRRIASRATLAASTRATLASYDWPGNVRELQNVLAALAVRSPRRGVVPPAALPAHVAGESRPAVWRLDAARRTFEEEFVRAALVRSGGQRGRAAAELGVTRQGLAKLLARLGIE